MKRSIDFLFILLCIFSVFKLRAQDLNTELILSIGGMSNDIASTVILEKNQDIVLCGTFRGTVDFAPGSNVNNLSSSGQEDVFIQKLDSTGNLIWAKRIGGPGKDIIYSSGTDSLNNIYLAGSFSGTADFDPDTSTSYYLTSSSGYQDIFILKLDSSGNFIWAKAIGGALGDEIYSIAVDLAGNVYATGAFADVVDFDPGSGTYNLTSSSVMQSDVFVLKLSYSGNFSWAKKYGVASFNDAGKAIILNDSANVYVTGHFFGNMDIDPGPGVSTVYSMGLTDVFIQKLDTSGNFIWGKSIGGASSEYATSLCYDRKGNIYLTGRFQSHTNFDPNQFYYLDSQGGSSDAYVEKISSSGNLIWVRGMGSDVNGEVGLAIKTDNTGNVYSTGVFKDTTDFNPGVAIENIVSRGAEDIYIQKLDSSGNLVWAKSIGSAGSDSSLSLMLDGKGNIFLSGYYSGVADLDPEQAISNNLSNGLRDAFLLKLKLLDTCNNLHIAIDSAKNINCADSGMIVCKGLQGFPPFQYSWNTIPASFDSVLIVHNSGIYEVTVSDIHNCMKKSSILINGPDTTSGYDLLINGLATRFRPGRSTGFWLNALNMSCMPINGTVSFIMDSLVSFDSSTVAPNLIVNDTIIWNLNGMKYDSMHFFSKLYLHTISTATTADTVCFTVKIDPVSGDNDSANNMKTYCFPVFNSHDPNTIDVYPLGKCQQQLIAKSQLLTYTIQFQNTGNSAAIDISIIDTLDTDLDINSVNILGSSHSMITEVLPGNVIKFMFNNIMLADSSSNESQSHGYLIYGVYPTQSAIEGTNIRNKADIYFDFNQPVTTNSVHNTITLGDVDTINCNETVDIHQMISPRKNQFSIYPNPASTSLIIMTYSDKLEKVFITNLLGEIITDAFVRDKSIVDVGYLAPGVYFVLSSLGTVKFIKQ